MHAIDEYIERREREMREREREREKVGFSPIGEREEEGALTINACYQYTSMLLFVYLRILSMLLDVVLFISDTVIYTQRPTLIPVMQVIEVSTNPHLVIIAF